ncbi:MAG TPA: ATP-binding cassette domain-containing protein [Acidimicrobiales bacterium]|nr:ATP-binding cassette domain-containing protein [Acidimicrobiales bacterium]
MPDLAVDGLTVEYLTGGETTRPLHAFDMRAAAGSVSILRGPSGSGKTTLLSCLAALLSPAAGTIAFGDIVVSTLAGKERTAYRRHTVGIVFQAFNLVPSLTATENVMVPLLADGVRRSDAARRAAAVLDRVGLADRAGHRPGELSGGQQQRVAIARAVVHDPPLLLADEPTAHLDQAHVEGVLALLAGLVDAERVVVVATHDDRLLSLGSQVVDLGGGLPRRGVERR